MKKQSVVLRVPIELVGRIDQYEKVLAQNGIKMGKSDIMRNFAENAITPKDNISSVFGVLNNASKKKL
jgi:hypothetical protein